MKVLYLGSNERKSLGKELNKLKQDWLKGSRKQKFENKMLKC